MGKLLHRIFRNELPQRLPPLAGRVVHLQLNNGKTVMGHLIAASAAQPVLLADMLGRKHRIEWSAIDEVIFDEVRA